MLRSAEQSRRRLRAALLAEPVLSRLLRAMLIEDPESHVLLLAMLDSALTSATRTQATVYRSGLFPVLLLRAASTRMTEEEARLLAEYHLRQEAGEVQHCFSDAADKSDLSALLETAGADVEKRVSIARRFSYLRFFLPSSLIALLTREGPTRFCEVFNAERVEEPEVLWSTGAAGASGAGAAGAARRLRASHQRGPHGGVGVRDAVGDPVRADR